MSKINPSLSFLSENPSTGTHGFAQNVLPSPVLRHGKTVAKKTNPKFKMSNELTTLEGAVPYICPAGDSSPVPKDVLVDVNVMPCVNPGGYLCHRKLRIDFRVPGDDMNEWAACTWIEAFVTERLDGVSEISTKGRIGAGAGLFTRSDCKDTVFVPSAIDVMNIRLMVALEERSAKPQMVHPARPLEMITEKPASPEFLALLKETYQVKPVIWNHEKLPDASMVTFNMQPVVRFDCGSPKLVFFVPLVEGKTTYKAKTALVLAP